MSYASAATTWSYRPGEWYAAFGPRATVLLPASQRDRVVGVWALVDGGAGFDEILDRLLAEGLSTLPGLVLIGTEDVGVRVLVRGADVAATVRANDEVVLDNAGVGTWVEQSFAAVTSLTVTVPGATSNGSRDDSNYAIPGGLVRVSRVDLPVCADTVAQEASATVSARGRTPALAVVPDVLKDWPAADDVPTGPLPAVDAVPAASLLISDGQTVVVDRPVLIGRAPEGRRLDSAEEPLLVAVPSPLNEISSTHVEIRPGAGSDLGAVIVTDMGSTNGTVIDHPGREPEDLKPGIAVALLPGAVISLGDGVTIDVTVPRDSTTLSES